MTHGATFFSAVSGAAWDDLEPLARVLGVTLAPESATVTPAHGRALWKELSYLGSNDLAYLLRGFEGVDYPEIVRDVCKHLKVRELNAGEDEGVVELNEQLVIRKLFADAWDQLSADERRELLRELQLDGGYMPLAGAGVAAAVLEGKAGGFAIYKLSVIVASGVTQGLLGRALVPGAHPALARVLASPARRKTVQAVALVASLRQAGRAALADTAFAEEGSVQTDVPTSAPKPKRRPAQKSAPGKKRAARKKRSQAHAATQQPPKKKRAPRRAKKKLAIEKRATTKKKAQRTAKKVGRKKR